jgi:hypothetical protein
MARLRRDKKKWRRHQALTSGHNIKVVPRLRDAQPSASTFRTQVQSLTSRLTKPYPRRDYDAKHTMGPKGRF